MYCTDELSITVNPLTQTVSEGGVAIFTATGRGIKTKQFKYEWVKIEGENLTAVERNAQLMINNLKIKDQGTYHCGITNEWKKTKNSEDVQLIVAGKIQGQYTHVLSLSLIFNNFTSYILCVCNSSTKSIHSHQ